jgi:hypothetical protein
MRNRESDQIHQINLARARATSSSLLLTNRLRALLFSVCFVVFELSPVFALSDSNYSMLLSESILRNHSTHLNGYRFPSPIQQSARCASPIGPIAIEFQTYQLDIVDGNVVYCYPNGTSLLSVPFVWVMNLFGVREATSTGECNRAGEIKTQRLLASLLMATLSVIVVFNTALLLVDTMPALVIAIGTAFGTQMWSTASRVMWSHTWFIFLGGLVAMVLLRREARVGESQPILLATLLSWMYFTRPTGIVPITCITIYMFAYLRVEFVAYAISGAVWFAAFVLYSWFTFGKVIPDYYLDSRMHPGQLASSLPAILFSPSRGLFVFVPILIFVFYLLIRYWQAVPHRRLATLAIAIVLLQFVTISCWPVWWGGLSYGPRLLTDLVPWFALIAILGCAARSHGGSSNLSTSEMVMAASLLILSIMINARGAISWSTTHWQLDVALDQHPERALDWSYPEFLAGLIPVPKYSDRSAP